MEAVRAIAAHDRRDGVVFKCVQNLSFGKCLKKKSRLKRFSSPRFVVTGFQFFPKLSLTFDLACGRALRCGYRVDKITSLLPPEEKNKIHPGWYINTKKKGMSLYK